MYDVRITSETMTGYEITKREFTSIADAAVFAQKFCAEGEIGDRLVTMPVDSVIITLRDE